MKLPPKCAYCKRNPASGVWRVVRKSFGRLTTKVELLCAECGLGGERAKHVVMVELEGADDPMWIKDVQSISLLASLASKPPADQPGGLKQTATPQLKPEIEAEPGITVVQLITEHKRHKHPSFVHPSLRTK